MPIYDMNGQQVVSILKNESNKFLGREDLDKLSFVNETLDNMMFRETNFESTAFDNCSMRHVELFDCNFKYSSHRNTNIVHSIVEGADFSHSKVNAASYNTVFRYCNFYEADITQLRANGCQFDSCVFDGAQINWNSHSVIGAILYVLA